MSGWKGLHYRYDPPPPSCLSTGSVKAEFLPRSLDDAYRVLNVNADTPKAVIEKLVQCLRRAWHPDHGAAEDRHLRTAKLQQINAAWDIVSGKRVVAANQ